MLKGRCHCTGRISLCILDNPQNRSYESSSRIFCSQRKTRVKFINKIDSEVAWMTRVLDENFSPSCLTVNLFYVLVNVLNRGVHCLTEAALSVTSIFFQLYFLCILHMICSKCCLTKLSAGPRGVKNRTDKTVFVHKGCSKNLLFQSFGREVAEFDYSHIKLH